MTIDEAITMLKFNNKHIADLKNDDLQQLAEWLEELKEYHTIGTPEELKKCTDILNKSETNELSKIIDEWLLYHKLGSVEECRAAVEKQKAEKPNH